MSLFGGRVRFWPRSLAGRTALPLIAAFAVVQSLGLGIHALDRMDLQHLGHMHTLGVHLAAQYRAVVIAPPDKRGEVLRPPSPDFPVQASVDPVAAQPPMMDGLPLPPPPPMIDQLLYDGIRSLDLPPALRPHAIEVSGDPARDRVAISLQLPDGPWLNLRLRTGPPPPWSSFHALTTFGLLTLLATASILWAARRLTLPVRTLAQAADALGRDVNAPALPESGPTELATAAAAFNRMAERIRRFVSDRTLLLAAIGHDLRTPITRMKLRAEFIDDDELRAKFLGDLDELETMVAATLAFGRDTASREPVVPLDLPTLLRTVLDEAADARPDGADRFVYAGPDHLTIPARLVALKRALTNLVSNAVKYGGDVRIGLQPPIDGQLNIVIEDTGPGIPPDELGRVFEPFHRLEPSRNRETGGTGLGLPIARNILRAHGGDVTLANRIEGGVRATVTLPV